MKTTSRILVVIVCGAFLLLPGFVSAQTLTRMVYDDFSTDGITRVAGESLNGAPVLNGTGNWVSSSNAIFGVSGGAVDKTNNSSYNASIAYTPPAGQFELEMRASLSTVTGWMALSMANTPTASIYTLTTSATLVRLLVYANGGISFAYGGTGGGGWSGNSTISAAANFNAADPNTKFDLLIDPAASTAKFYVNDVYQGVYNNFMSASSIQAFGFYVNGEAIAGGSEIQSFAIFAVPEPTSMTLLILSLFGSVLVGKKKQRSRECTE